MDNIKTVNVQYESKFKRKISTMKNEIQQYYRKITMTMMTTTIKMECNEKMKENDRKPFSDLHIKFIVLAIQKGAL